MAAVKDVTIEIAEDYQKRHPSATWEEAMNYACTMREEEFIKWTKKCQ